MIEFDAYLKALAKHDRHTSTELTYRPELTFLLNSISGSTDPNIKITHEPKRLEEYGAPDYKITQSDRIIGYVETKDIGAKLDEVLKSEQIKRYKTLSNNIILTDYLQWIWLKDGKVADRQTLCYTSDLDNHRFKPDADKVKQVRNLLNNFFSTAPEGIAHPKKLATALAQRAHLLKEYIWSELKRQEKEDSEGKLIGLYKTFKNLVDHELTLEDFTDTFAQMLVYGLFMARLNSGKDSIDLYNVEKYIPGSFELIRELVSFLKELDKPEYSETRWIVEEVLTVLNTMDSRAIHEVLSFNRTSPKSRRSCESGNIPGPPSSEGRQEYSAKDPYIYFYEDFLAAYDKKLRKAKGVYYTPLPVVNFIVRAIDDVLKDTFGIAEGLADHKKVTVLDFACGTGTFILEIVRQILDNSPDSKHDLLIREHILKNIFGFEYMIAPYTVAHLKLSQFLKDKGYPLTETERFNVFLTNTLEHIENQKDYLLPALSKESNSALKVKDKPILVITGNPPYSYVSKNNGEFISKLIKDYYFVDGKPLGERNPKGLQDDYVKFIRIAQWKMQNVEEGMVAIITNHSFLDNPTFRGMRQSLMQTFNQMYFLDLHGNAKKKEKAPDGSKDENVFDIMQGVCISLLIKSKSNKSQLNNAEYFGTREVKYTSLLNDSFAKLDWKQITSSKQNLFIAQDNALSSRYEKHYSIQDMFSLSNVGIVTARDSLTIQDTKDKMMEVVKDFANLSIEDARERYDLGPDSRDWKIHLAQKDIVDSALSEPCMKRIQYRVFDKRYTYYTGITRGFISMPRYDIMRHMLQNNIGIITPRQVAEGIFSHAIVSDSLIDNRLTSSNKGYAYLFPLYLYEEVDFLGTTQWEKKPNIKPEIIKSLTDKYKQTVSPEQIMSYIYAVLHSPTYRDKYANFLKTDFPRIPFTDDFAIFTALAEIGWDLISAHLQKKAELHTLYKGMGSFSVKGDNTVEKPHYTEAQQRLYINSDQYFAPVPAQVYDFYIGGYQVLSKYLKDRKGRTLTLDEINNVEHVVKILQFTIDTMQEIDKLTREWI
jgi:hypothetical protein